MGQTSIALTSHDGAVEVDMYPPPEAGGGEGWTPTFPAFGEWYGPDKLAQFVDEDLSRRMAKHQTPASAPLGASFGPDGKPRPAVRIEDARLGQTPVAVASDRTLRWQSIVAFADALGLSIVADHYTRPERLKMATGTASAVLENAADSFHSVFRLSSRYLVARRVPWPDDDLAEAHWPLVEDWIARKEKGQPLTFDDITTMAGLPDPALDALAAYNDGAISFSNEMSGVRMTPGQRDLLAQFGRLTAGQKAAARTAGGLPLAQAPVPLRRAVLKQVRERIAAPASGGSLLLARDSLQFTQTTYMTVLRLALPGGGQPVELARVFADL